MNVIVCKLYPNKDFKNLNIKDFYKYIKHGGKKEKKIPLITVNNSVFPLYHSNAKTRMLHWVKELK
jgi:hypothetical protein